MDTVICGEPVLRLAEKHSLEHTSSYSKTRKKDASVLFI